MKKGEKKIKLLKLIFRKLYKKLKNEIEISEGATYNVSLQLKYCEETLGGEGNYLTRFELCKGKVLYNTI